MFQHTYSKNIFEEFQLLRYKNGKDDRYHRLITEQYVTECSDTSMVFF